MPTVCSSSQQQAARVTSTECGKERSSADSPLLHCITLQQCSQGAQRQSLHPAHRKTTLAWQLRLSTQANIVFCSKNSLKSNSCYN